MSVTITDHSVSIEQDLTVKASVFLRAMADVIVDISTPKTPKDSGRLRADVLRQVLGLNGKLKWMKKYAGIQEVKQFRNYTTAGTGPHYAENAVKEGVRRTNTVAKKAGLI